MLFLEIQEGKLKPTGMEGIAVLVNLHELQASGCHHGLIAVGLANTVVHHEQDAWFNTIVVGVHQYRALLELAAVCREDEVGRGMH